MSNPNTKMRGISSERENRLFGVGTSVFKAYDIRGVCPEEINKELAYKTGFATIKFCGNINLSKLI